MISQFSQAFNLAYKWLSILKINPSTICKPNMQITLGEFAFQRRWALLSMIAPIKCTRTFCDL
uniref:Uncharacterized protein n=1 Tax=Anguilla anguilla TaxID=7936 RepID=A0A0E9XLN1_ANGAN